MRWRPICLPGRSARRARRFSSILSGPRARLLRWAGDQPSSTPRCSTRPTPSASSATGSATLRSRSALLCAPSSGPSRGTRRRIGHSRLLRRHDSGLAAAGPRTGSTRTRPRGAAARERGRRAHRLRYAVLRPERPPDVERFGLQDDDRACGRARRTSAGRSDGPDPSRRSRRCGAGGTQVPLEWTRGDCAAVLLESPGVCDPAGEAPGPPTGPSHSRDSTTVARRRADDFSGPNAVSRHAPGEVVMPVRNAERTLDRQLEALEASDSMTLGARRGRQWSVDGTRIPLHARRTWLIRLRVL